LSGKTDYGKEKVGYGIFSIKMKRVWNKLGA